MNKINSPRDLELSLLREAETSKAYILEFFEDKIPCMVVCVELNTLSKIRSSISVKFRNKIFLKYKDIIDSSVPDGFKTDLLLVI